MIPAKAQPNNSFNRSANSIAFMRETLLVITVRRARLIRALDASWGNRTERIEMRTEEYSIFIRGKIVAICEAMLREEMGIIAGSRRLIGLGLELFDDHDEDF